MSEQETPKRTRKKSPNHPAIGLQDAIRRTELIFNDYKRSPITVSMACTKIGFSNYKSSSAAGAIAALVAYGLVDSNGRGDERKLTVSESGERIIRSAPDRKELIKNAAENPKLHKELIGKFVADGELSHDDLITNYLLWDRKPTTFNEDSLGPFIRRFKTMLKYSGIVKLSLIHI